MLCYLDRPDVSGGEALAGVLRPGNAGSNTAADHVKVLDMAIAALPAHARPRLLTVVLDDDVEVGVGR